MRIVIASRNIHKVRELREMFKPYPKFDVLSLLDYPDYVPPEEGIVSLEMNAKEKARDAAMTLRQWVIADDTGLFVPALQGQPGVQSSRYAGPTATDKENRRKLIVAMRSFEDTARHAYFECWLVVADPGGVKKSACGLCEGIITSSEWGASGFGYDSLFMKHGYCKTFAEMDELLKNRISHRRKAFDKLASFFDALSRDEYAN